MGAYFEKLAVLVLLPPCRASARVRPTPGLLLPSLTVYAETTKRGTLHQRAKIQQKVRETHKKNKKAAKRNPQWKTSAPLRLL
jgi:hypothetical protein